MGRAFNVLQPGLVRFQFKLVCLFHLPHRLKMLTAHCAVMHSLNKCLGQITIDYQRNAKFIPHTTNLQSHQNLRRPFKVLTD